MKNSTRATVRTAGTHSARTQSVAPFPARTVPSFFSLAGVKAAGEYYDALESLEDQTVRRASKRRSRKLA